VLREFNDPAARLLDAAQRYTDGLRVAAEQLVGSRTLAELDRVDKYLPGLTDEPAWPTLRAHLIDLAAETGEHPLRHLHEAACGCGLATAGDMAAVLYWRLRALAPTNPGPLPSLPGVPRAIQDHPVWGNYLAKRAHHVAEVAGQIRSLATRADDQPVWAPPGSHPSTALIGDIAVWRAARGIDPKTHGQPEGTNARLPRTYGNNTSTEMLPAPSSRTTPTSISDRHRIRHSATVTTAPSARIKHHGRTLHLRPAASDRSHQAHNSFGRRLCLSDRQLTADSDSMEIKAPRERAAAGRRYAGAPSGGCSSTRGLYSTS
jgi:hypothetical protein